MYCMGSVSQREGFTCQYREISLTSVCGLPVEIKTMCALFGRCKSSSATSLLPADQARCILVSARGSGGHFGGWFASKLGLKLGARVQLSFHPHPCPGTPFTPVGSLSASYPPREAALRSRSPLHS
ncbi:hypothetical protein FKM82_022890 [Ascaphus truei]